MAPKQKASKQVADQTSTQTHKNTPTSDTSSKTRDNLIPTKDKSPDDLEILD